MALKLSCALATSMKTPEHIAVAEQLGYQRAWCYDSPALYPDVWVQLCRAADRTSTIGLGPGVLIPSLRHPMTNAAAVATLAALAGPDRVAVALGSGFTGRFVLGKKPMRWADVAAYVRCLRALLRGEVTEWEGAKIQMIHPEGFGAPRPIEVPILIGTGGPKGAAVAKEVADGVFVTGKAPSLGLDHQVALMFGTVLDEGEDVDSTRVLDAAGHGVAVAYHSLDAHGRDVNMLPGGAAWVAAYADVAPEVRHLAVHDRHLVAVNDRDRPIVTGAVIKAMGSAYSASELAQRLAELESIGTTEVAYQPAGPNIERELEAFAAVALG